MKIMVVLGTRPEAIKLAPVVAMLRSAYANSIQTTVVSTGQHKEMLAQALSFFHLVPDIEVGVMTHAQTLNTLASRVLQAMDAVLEAQAPDWIIVQGDTTTAFCAGLAAFQRGIKVAHVEAGLRTGNLSSPFPEEANRSMLARIASRHFAPTLKAAANLMAEGIARDGIVVTGNTVVDAIDMVVPPSRRDQFHVARQGATRPQVLVTCHRRENFGSIMADICAMLSRLCARYAEHNWVFPVHLNPAVREPVMRVLSGIPNLRLIDPVSYPESLALIAGSQLVLTDSGGIQEEAPSFSVPVVVMREHTERSEGVDAGFASLAGQNPSRIEAEVALWLDASEKRNALLSKANPYGDGFAAKRIVDSLLGHAVEAFHG
ncbi:UDP-N-acetylglucosamine 2-epimerase [Robbsia andropogonis]|uniref:UDP-N-acetylglucosamine 2-epimerase (non-hydrolyzing) n=1 Tax=Robbsia andropogonis TaxID=28092 RepID=A0A0F5K132_9BURK|nr:UDP-N-acetylglucosamine 2-epimerase (non-hydrolyzing) [Robbsia andropogonis]KKB63831.1 UDP-N-acetylglucosamine 2-epimerase [Robbsia andropogonis]MCP1116607.1 UDP-N-acetylglucosamine 2-epimerase (non-hydrolyzing) [Robbsia andropogonis]MCP1126714.1 UDP-N-acetylglucosamine 2-epimerase (non-hydrolyzing) [Robbsia andropogonis]